MLTCTSHSPSCPVKARSDPWSNFSLNFWFVGCYVGCYVALILVTMIFLCVCVCVCVCSDFFSTVCEPMFMKLRFELNIGMWLCPLKTGRAASSGAEPSHKKLFFAENLSRPTVLIASGCLLDMFHFIGIQNFSRAIFSIADIFSET